MAIFRTYDNVREIRCWSCGSEVDPDTVRVSGYSDGRHQANCSACGLLSFFNFPSQPEFSLEETIATITRGCTP